MSHFIRVFLEYFEYTFEESLVVVTLFERVGREKNNDKISILKFIHFLEYKFMVNFQYKNLDDF